jgi:hypothetical protein
LPCPRKLTNEQVYAIRCRYVPHSRIDGMNALAKAYGVGSGTIENIVTGMTYKEAPYSETPRQMPSKMITPEVLAFVRKWFVPWHRERGLKAFAHALGVDKDTLRKLLRKTPGQ